MTYAADMVELAKKYQDSIQFAFKPHPVLKFRLINIWGEQKTEEYYKLWETMPNTQLETGDYIDLFLTSDALGFLSVPFIWASLVSLSSLSLSLLPSLSPTLPVSRSSFRPSLCTHSFTFLRAQPLVRVL